MSEQTPETAHSSARTIAERIVARSLPAQSTSEAAALGAEQVFALLFQNLSQWIGSAGCQALFSRAFVLCAASQPVCEGVRYRTHDAEPQFDRLAENARACGVETTIEGITDVVTSILTMLTGLIGDERMVMSLIETEPSAPSSIVSRMTPDLPSYHAGAPESSRNGTTGRLERRHGRDRRNHD